MFSDRQQNLFTLLERGDRKIMKIKNKVIALVGLARVGKSAVYNWILGKEMVGQENLLQTNYLLQYKEQDCALMSDRYVPATLVPNIVDIDSQTTLIDLAGYLESRNHAGVLAVSYFMTSILQMAKEVKFMIVLTENSFFDVKGNSVKNSLLGFLKMFKRDLLTPEYKDKIFSSISLVCTRSNKPYQLHNYLLYVTVCLKDPELIVQDKWLLIQMLDWIIRCNRIQAFKIARPHQTAETCTILQNFNKINWNFLKLYEIECQTAQKLIKIPYQDDVISLSHAQSSALTDVITNHFIQFKQFMKVIHSSMKQFKQNWLYRIQNHKKQQPQSFMDSLLNFKNIFDQIRSFLDKTDKYKSDQLIQTNFKMYQPPPFTSMIKSILQIYNITERISDELVSPQFRTNGLQYIFQQLTNSIRILCLNSQEERLILRMMFVINRGCRQLSVLYKIDKQRISSVYQTIKKSNIYLPLETKHQYLSYFIKYMNADILNTIMTTLTQIQQYESLYHQYMQCSICDSQQELMQLQAKFIDLSINICFVKCNLLAKANDKIRGVSSCINLLHQLSRKQSIISSSVNTQIENAKQQKLNQIDKIYFMKLQIIKNIIKILISLDKNQYINAKDLAIALCEYSKLINLACQVYELQLLDFPDNTEKRHSIMDKYAQHCIRWGRYPQAKIILQKKLELLSDMYKRQETINKMSSIIEEQQKLLGQEKQHLTELKKRFPLDDETLVELLTQVVNAIQYNQ